MKPKTERELDIEHEKTHRQAMRKVLDDLEAACTPIMQSKEAIMVVFVRLPCGCQGHLSNTNETAFLIDWLANRDSMPVDEVMPRIGGVVGKA